MKKLTELKQYANLSKLAFSFKKRDIASLFKAKNRADCLTFQTDKLLCDFSKQLVDEQVISELIELARQQDLEKAINQMFSGGHVNAVEKRAALHTALRNAKEARLELNGKSVSALVNEQLRNIETLVNQIHAKQKRGYSGRAITDIVNIGVGGSDLGPFMACQALDEFTPTVANQINVHFASSMDGSQIFSLLDDLNPETTLFIIASKSFTTVDTFYNANTALDWMVNACLDKSVALKHHFIGVSACTKKMTQYGITPENQLQIWDWVGGRFSLWSTIGLSIAIKLGMDNFRLLLAGAHKMDQHFLCTPFESNIPVLLGLIGVWNATFLGINGHAVLPYDGRLKALPDYLTQLEMESNGKSVTVDGQQVEFPTCPILWGEVGSNAQHAFYQLLHQGTQKVSSDFIAAVKRYQSGRGKSASGTNCSLIKQHQLSLANCLAQSRVLAFGNAAVDENIESEHKRYRGNQPSTTILIDELTPESLGMLIAMYEHKVYVMATIWGINPFDQWGVELGKKLSFDALDAMLSGNIPASFDSSSQCLIKHILKKAKEQ